MYIWPEEEGEEPGDATDDGINFPFWKRRVSYLRFRLAGDLPPQIPAPQTPKAAERRLIGLRRKGDRPLLSYSGTIYVDRPRQMAVRCQANGWITFN